MRGPKERKMIMRGERSNMSNKLKEENGGKEHRKSATNNKRREDVTYGGIKGKRKIGDMKEKIKHQK